MGRRLEKDIGRARSLRASMGEPERALWRILFWFRREGFHFRRQAQLGPYFVDFACHHAGLVIEVDGSSHDSEDAQAADRRRDAYLEARGYRVLRISNAEAMRNADGVYLKLADSLRGHTPTLDPSPQGGGRRKSRSRIVESSAMDQSGLPPPCGEGTGVGDTTSQIDKVMCP
ncbi:Very-short-patch-repair endonuclease [Devosia enhydra]|uniref:Very-short-patch-repair endonuclease n=1 Tax=Devosia enhydra TaxID=665118 RepID=A0A1K2HXD8_9HYPH|nr:endonuclease domain-containing protein [Devosia enhydra]SFZ84322.1 Very-short-patch-repair endonuclease [Devosia enhydra]